MAEAKRRWNTDKQNVHNLWFIRLSNIAWDCHSACAETRWIYKPSRIIAIFQGLFQAKTIIIIIGFIYK